MHDCRGVPTAHRAKRVTVYGVIVQWSPDGWDGGTWVHYHPPYTLSPHTLHAAAFTHARTRL